MSFIYTDEQYKKIPSSHIPAWGQKIGLAAVSVAV